MDWFKIVLIVCIIVQEFQILALYNRCESLEDLLISYMAGKVKTMITYLEDDEDGDEDEQPAVKNRLFIFYKKYDIINM